MFLRTVATIARFSLAILPLLAVAAAGCGGSSNSTGKAGSTGSAGSTGVAGTTGSAGSTGSAGTTGTAGTSGAKDCTVAAATAADATILDFSVASATAPAFGGYMPGTYGGGTFIYPDKGTEADLMGLSNDVRRHDLAHHRPGQEVRGLRPLPDVGDGRLDVRRASSSTSRARSRRRAPATAARRRRRPR